MLTTKEPLSDLEALKVEKIFSIKSVAGISRPYLSSEVGWSLYNGAVEGEGLDTFALRIGYFLRRHSMRIMSVTPMANRIMPPHLMGAAIRLMADMTRLMALSK